MKSIVSAFAALALIVTAVPAMANSSNAADIAAPLRAAQEARQSSLNNGDEEFRQLFANWRSLDRGFVSPANSAAPNGLGIASPAPLARMGAVSIPSRMPVDGVRLTSDYGMRFHPVVGGRRMHKGIDLAGPIGTPIHAAADAVVGKAEWFGGYGLYVSLEHGGDIETRYGHMSRLNVFAGQRIRKGDVIGYIGTTGRSTGPHLHYEVRIAGEAVNPIPYMQADMLKNAPAQDANAPLALMGGISK